MHFTITQYFLLLVAVLATFPLVADAELAQRGPSKSKSKTQIPRPWITEYDTQAPTQPPTGAPEPTGCKAPFPAGQTPEAPSNVAGPEASCPCPSTPSVTALEYLGTGYNIFEGNPRGGLNTELDPGFRSSIIKLVTEEGVTTQNGEFRIPLGTDLRYTTTCQFASKSNEIASTSQYQRELSSEATVTRQTSASGNILGFKFGSDSFFSRSERYESFSSNRATTQTTSFESKALCTEFEARLHRFHTHEREDDFNRALATLPTSFNRDDEMHKQRFGDFLNEYGTHYVNYVVLGAKQVYSLEMMSIDVIRLQNQGVSVAQSTSSKTMFGFERSADVGVSGTVPGTPAEVSVMTTVTVEASTSSTNTDTRAMSRKEEQLEMIRQSTTTVVETNIGGTPPSNGQWQNWAATAKIRPMPIMYELSEVTEFMSEEVAEAFANYLEYYLEQGRSTDNRQISDALHFGVAGPEGEAISSYTLDPISKQRALTQFQEANSTGLSIDKFFRYNILWEGSGDYESAVFVTLIRDNLCPNEQEDLLEFGVINDQMEPYMLQVPFGLRLAPGKVTAAIFGVDLDDKLNLTSFSYLAADNIPNNTFGYVAGAVHPQGYATNNVFGSNIGFKISQTNDREYIVTFSTPFKEPPTTLFAPLWFPRSDALPTQIGEVIVGSRGCTVTECKLQVGSVRPNLPANFFSTEDRFLGFSFMSFDGAMNNTAGMVHGRVELVAGNLNVNITAPADGKGKNFTATPMFKRTSFGFLEFESFGGVLIEFANEFIDIPSVIVTPEIGTTNLSQSDFDGKALDDYTIPYVVVEHITTSQIFVKAAILFYAKDADSPSSLFLYTPVSFSFVAVGPVQ